MQLGACLVYNLIFSKRPLPLGSTHCKGMQSIHCVLVACHSGRDSYRKTMSNEEGHNCLNNENKINMKVWILNIDV